MNAASPLRIGIPFIADTWLGGVNYVIHLFQAGHSLPKDIRPRLVLVVPEQYLKQEAVLAHRRLLPLADYIIAQTTDRAQAEKLLGPQVMTCATQAEIFEHIDFFFPVQSDVLEGWPAASWIPDFQHKRLPHYFSQETLDYRDGIFAQVAKRASHVVFSSKAARNDFRRFFPGSEAKESILHFYTVPESSWFAADPNEVRTRYNLPRNYLICCNQFWSHKDHKTLFSAIATLKRMGRPMHLVCTGPTQDYRNKGYFAELKAMLKTLGIDKSVHILGAIDRMDQIQLLRGSLAVVQPSLFEGWSTVVEDSRALGKTIFLTDIDVHLEQAPEHGIFFKAGDPADLTEKIIINGRNLGPTQDTDQETQARIDANKRTRLFGLQLLRIAQDGARHPAPAPHTTAPPNSQTISTAPLATQRREPTHLPRITIVTPSFNQGDCIERTILSVLDQEYPNLEFIVMDGGSTDNTVDILRAYDEHIDYWVSEKDKGQSHAINKGLARATGEIFNWLNSDDWLEPGALQQLAAAWISDSGATAWVGGCRRVDPEGHELSIIFPNGMTLDNMGENWNGRQFYQPSCFLKTSTVRDLGGVDTNLHFCMDLHLWLRLAKQGRFVAGQGIWTTALIHPKAKTQSMRHEMHLETVQTIKALGFPQGALSRERHALHGLPHDFVMPRDLQNRINGLRNPAQVEDLKLQGRQVAVLSNFLPRHDLSSANHRLLQIIRLMQQAGATITYLYYYETDDDQRYAQDLGLSARRIPDTPEAAAEVLAADPPEVLWISNLWTPEYMALQINSMHAIRTACPATRIVVDTMDLHSQKFMRRYDQSRSLQDQNKAQSFLALERTAYPLADDVIAVSAKERKAILEAIPDAAPVTVIPNIHMPTSNIVPMRNRNHLVFLGNYEVNHNADAARHFVDKILPHILKRHPDIQIHFVGHAAQSTLSDLQGASTQLIGYVPDLNQALSCYRVFVCPMTYGSGLKGKVGMAASAGLPVVTTSVGAEGFGFTDGVECFIADDPENFALKTLHLYDDNVAWNNFSLQGVLAMAERFSPRAVAVPLNTLLNKR